MPTKTREKPRRTVSLDVDYQLHPKQLEIVRSPARFKVVAAGRRFGKSELGVSLGLFGDGHRLEGAASGSRVWWIGPDYPRAVVGWNLAKRFTQSIPPSLVKVSEADKKMEFVTGGFFQVKSGYDPDSLRGEGLDYVIPDENAFGKEEAWTEGLRPALADRRGGALFISTPKGFNHFHTLYEKGMREDDSEWQSFHFTSYDNPHVPDEEIDAAREDYENAGQEHVFRQEFLAQFLEGAGLPVFSRAWWNGKNRYDPRDKRLLDSGIGWWIAGDTANKDKDENAYSVFVVGQFTRRYELLIREVVRGRWTFDQLLGVLVQLAHRYRGNYLNSLRYLFIEDAASGTALVQTLRHSAPPWIANRTVGVKPTRYDKEVRWNEASVWCRRDFVKFPYPDESNAHWLLPFEDEIFNVPGAKYFDQADAFSILINQVKLHFAAAYRRRGGV